MWFDKPCNHKLSGSMTAPGLIHSTEVLLLADSEFLGVTGYNIHLNWMLLWKYLSIIFKLIDHTPQFPFPSWQILLRLCIFFAIADHNLPISGTTSLRNTSLWITTAPCANLIRISLVYSPCFCCRGLECIKYLNHQKYFGIVIKLIIV